MTNDDDPLLRQHKGRILVYEHLIRHLIEAIADAHGADADALRRELKRKIEYDVASLKLAAVGKGLQHEIIGIDKAIASIFSDPTEAPPAN